MPNKMLIDASHREETRVVVTRGNRIEEFDFESQDKKQLKGNIYLARVTRVEPSLQAAFVEYGGNRHGFLAFSEIHPDYYQIPVADRQALLRADAEAAEAEEEEDEAEERGRNRRRGRSGRSRRRGGDQDHARPEAQAEGEESADATGENPAAGETEDDVSGNADGNGPAMAARAEADVISERAPRDDDANGDNGADEGNGANSADDEVESVGAEDALEEVPSRRKQARRQYKIQEVIKRRQILLVQVVKEERGNKGAALTTYLSLAGRYSVLMPNTARGGGISRKITSAQDRKRLKDVVSDLDVPEGMGVILRTAGANRTKAEIKRDYEYLMRLWENVRNLTLASSAPALVYEEGSLIKRSVRDLYNKDIEEILVAGEDGYREAKDFMRMLMPSHAKMVQPYRDIVPIFARNGIEAQLDRMLQPQVTLKSGGYIIINQTEALVSIDVNSGRSTKEHSIEDTALQTNLEAAEEVARQLRLRDLAGLIVIDFIDMEENRNNRSVEKRLKDHLKHDRARIQVGRISHFGLLEMSRQRIRASVLESTMKPCPHCGGTGHVRSDSSVALHVVRGIEEALLKDARNHISVRTPVATALYVLNHKRDSLVEMEARFGLTITIEADDTVGSQHFVIARGMAVENPVTQPAPSPMPAPEVEEEIDQDIETTQENEAEIQVERSDAANGEEGEQGRRKRRRRRRRGGRDREAGAESERVHTAVSTGDDNGPAPADAREEDEPVADSRDSGVHAEESEGDRKKRRRGKRGGKRNRKDEAAAEGGSEAAGADLMGSEELSQPESPAEAETASEAIAEEPAPVEKPKRARRPSKRAAAVEEAAPPVEAKAESAEAEAAVEQPSPASVEAAQDEAVVPKRRASRRKAVPAEAEAEETTKPVVVSTGANDAEAEEVPKPRKGGWWQRKGFF